MTYLGTRPPTVDEWEQYELHHRSRMSTKPGITGMWQVSGRTQTPHSYRFDELWTVHNQAIEDGVINMAASCLLMQKYGYTTYFSKGSEKNIKITTVGKIDYIIHLASNTHPKQYAEDPIGTIMTSRPPKITFSSAPASFLYSA